MNDVAERVARGAEWLDLHYPNWFQGIDLSVLKISSCHECVLGQVYTGVIPTAERQELLSQLIASMPNWQRKTWEEMVERGDLGGYTVLVENHRLVSFSGGLGFSIGWDNPQGEADDAAEYAALLDAWTEVIIERRLRAHPDVNDLSCSLAELRVPATVS